MYMITGGGGTKTRPWAEPDRRTWIGGVHIYRERESERDRYVYTHVHVYKIMHMCV